MASFLLVNLISFIILFIGLVLCGVYFYKIVALNRYKVLLKVDYSTQQLKKQHLQQQISQLQDSKSTIIEDINKLSSTCDKAASEYQSYLQRKYVEVESQYLSKVNELNKIQDNLKAEIEKYKQTKQAIILAQRKEAEAENSLEDHKMDISSTSLRQVSILRSVQPQLLDPRPLRMVIWNSYYSKAINNLCAKVLGTNAVTGIYKLTNLLTKEVYIGQAVNVRDRWRQHCKCGLGIDTPADRKLYKAMLKDGLQNFTFELLQECRKEDLNEKQRFYIDYYKSYYYGYNSNRGIQN